MSYIGTEPKDIRSFGRTKFDYTATQGQTAFTGADDDGKVLAFTAGQIEVYVNGILMDDSDFTTTGTGTVTLASAANLNDVINIVSFESNIPDNDYVPATGGTFTGNVTHTGAFTSQGIDDNANATAITIDSSENVLVGKTAVGNTSGIELRGSIGYSSFTRDGNFPVTARRLTNDGDIVQFEKDTTVVGSIGSTSGVVSNIVLDPRSSVKGSGLVGGSIDTNTGIINPTDRTGALSDGNINLGSSSGRFKDLYLSGGAYIGGTGSANHLDDYEYGTWNVSLSGVTVSGGTTEATYVKVGRQVTAIASFTNVTVSGGNTVTITGLPFTAAIRSTTSVPALYYHGNGGQPVYALLEKNTANMFLQYNRSNNSWASATVTSGSNRYIHFSITYTV